MEPEQKKEMEEFQKIRDKYKIPFSCPACDKLMMNYDDRRFYQYGICNNCYICFIADRDFNKDFLRDRDKILNYIKQKIANKTK